MIDEHAHNATHTEPLSPKQLVAIEKLLQYPRPTEAAAAASISWTTLWRWQQTPAFRAAYAQAQRQGIEAAIANLQTVSAEAVETLRRNLNCGRPAVEVRAAEVILTFALRSHELLDIAQRLEQLEATVETRQERKEAS